MKREGYAPRQYPNGAVCNAQSAACTAGMGTDQEVGEASVALFTTVAGGPVGGAVARLWLGGRAAATGFFEGAYYSEKVLVQATRVDDLFHGFPQAVDGFAAAFGQASTRVGGDGARYTWLTIRGEFMNKPGVFEYIKDAAGRINHRMFKPD